MLYCILGKNNTRRYKRRKERGNKKEDDKKNIRFYSLDPYNELKRRRELKKRLQELKKRDPFIYK